ncbi:hypothetical protein D3C73_1021000 [compost metagenome]
MIALMEDRTVDFTIFLFNISVALCVKSIVMMKKFTCVEIYSLLGIYLSLKTISVSG